MIGAKCFYFNIQNDIVLKKGEQKSIIYLHFIKGCVKKIIPNTSITFETFFSPGFFFIKENFLPFQAEKKNMKYVFAIYTPLQLACDYYARNIVFYANDLFSFFDRVLLQKFYLLLKYHRDKGSMKSST